MVAMLPTIPLNERAPAELIALASPAKQRQFYKSLSEDDAEELLYDWLGFWARPKQRVPETLGKEHLIWMILSGRGWGKSRTGGETIKYLVEEKGYRHIALIGRTAADVRDVMVEGPSGLLNCYPPEERPIYEPAKRRITFANGAVAHTYSADKPDQLRGPQHDLVWADELAAWRYEDAWDQTMFGLRLGKAPIAIITTTPRPTKIIKELAADPTVYLTVGTTYENAANLAGPALKRLIDKYAGTTLGQQELEAKILSDTPGALWTRDILSEHRKKQEEVPDLVRVVVGIDPATTSNENSAETGIVAVGIDRFKHIYVLDDWSMQGRPSEWAKRGIELYNLHDADRIVAEVNQGGDMVETTIRTEAPSISIKQVRATKGKYTRAEPVSALYEQGRVHHVGIFSELEDQMCTWIPTDAKSPDRIDALVWAITELALKNNGKTTTSKAKVKGMYPSQTRKQDAWERNRRR
jgi:phage terminase large subunit-like protein